MLDCNHKLVSSDAVPARSESKFQAATVLTQAPIGSSSDLIARGDASLRIQISVITCVTHGITPFSVPFFPSNVQMDLQ